MNLLEMQRRMAEDVMRPLTAEFQMQPATSDGRSTTEIAESYVKPNSLLTSLTALKSTIASTGSTSSMLSAKTSPRSTQC